MMSGAVIRSFSCDRHVVRVRLPQTSRGNLDHFDVALQLRNGTYAAISHTAAEPTNHLVQNVRYRPLVRHTPLDSLGHHFGGRHLAFLEVPVGGAILHRRKASHAPDHLEAAALGEYRFSR